jgi:hypothetical protein
LTHVNGLQQFIGIGEGGGANEIGRKERGHAEPARKAEWVHRL